MINPVPNNHVRIYSPLSQDIYKDIPLENFCEVEVNTKGLEESNHFLLSLWNEMNQILHPKKNKYVPWFYNPSVVATNKNAKLLKLGEIHTSSGNFHLLLWVKEKRKIKSILAYNSKIDKETCDELFVELVRQAKQNADQLRTYVSKVRLRCLNTDAIPFIHYSGSNYYLHSDRKGVCVDVKIHAIDYIEAQQQLIKRLDHLCAFLAVETNLYFVVDIPPKITESQCVLPIAADKQYIQPYIDGPAIREGVVLISESGAKYLEEQIFVDRDITEEEKATYFRRACSHVYEGLGKQLELGEIIAYTTATQNFLLRKIDVPLRQNIITTASLSYLSALETVSVPEGKPEICNECNNPKYKIGSRVKDFVTKYMNEDTGKVFKKLYDFRSQYLHAGKLSCDSYQITSRPFLDPDTGTGLSDYGFISTRVNGELISTDIHTTQELTTYMLRCYYQEHLFGVKDFEPQDDHSHDVDFKKIIKEKLQKAMPKGVKVIEVTWE